MFEGFPALAVWRIGNSGGNVPYRSHAHRPIPASSSDAGQGYKERVANSNSYHSGSLDLDIEQSKHAWPSEPGTRSYELLNRFSLGRNGWSAWFSGLSTSGLQKDVLPAMRPKASKTISVCDCKGGRGSRIDPLPYTHNRSVARGRYRSICRLHSRVLQQIQNVSAAAMR